jgi:pimeloyl-ACP methyl ester carboxylesterase
MSERFSVPATRGTVQAGPTQLSYLDWGGDGPAALLLHGITSDARAWWRAALQLRDAGRRVIAMDMPGHGASEMSRAHEIDAIGALAGDAVVALGLRELLLIGHSWGGATALALASGAHPARELLASVVLVDPALGMSAAWGEARLPFYLEGVGEPAAVNAPRLRARNPDWLDEDVHWKALALEQCRAEQVRGFFTPAADYSLAPRLADVGAPLLLLVADPAHTVIAPERLAEARAVLAGGDARIVELPGTTHNMLRGHSYAPTMDALMGWIASNR